MKLFKLDGGGEDSSEELFYCNGDIEDVKAAVEEKKQKVRFRLHANV